MTAFFHKYIMLLKELDNFKLSDALHFHKELNPAIFDGDSMNNEVREQLLLIAQDFIEHLGISDLDVKDVTISGSNAAYSYTKYSDLDLHILVDMSQFNDDDVYRELFDAKKVVYNEQHDIQINGIDVELYVQDSNVPVISLGEYSVLNNKWIRLPRKSRANFDQVATKLKFDKIVKLAEYALRSNSFAKINKVLKTIKKYRQAGLDKNGEFGPENLAYKALRSKGLVSALYDKMDTLHSKHLSLPESELLDKPEMTVTQLAKKHNVSKDHINAQLAMGIKVEMEHTSKYDVAKEIALDHLAENPNYYTELDKVDLDEAFDKPYVIKWESSDYGDVDALARLPDGSPLSIMFNQQQDNDGDSIVQVEFYRNNSQEVTGEGDAQRIFATVLSAIQKYIKKYKPLRLTFSASKDNWAKQQQNSESRASLYDRLVQRYAESWGYKADRTDNSDLVIYELSRINKNVEESASGYIPSEKEKNDPRFKTALTVDVKPDTLKKNAKAFGFNVTRAGIPPLLRK